MNNSYADNASTWRWIPNQAVFHSSLALAGSSLVLVLQLLLPPRVLPSRFSLATSSVSSWLQVNCFRVVCWLFCCYSISPSHHPKCFWMPPQYLCHAAEHFPLPGCLPELWHRCLRCPSSCVLPATSAQSNPRSAPACFSNPVIILLANLNTSMFPATTSGIVFRFHAGKRLFQHWHTAVVLWSHSLYNGCSTSSYKFI